MKNEFFNYCLRLANDRDEELLLYWANDPLTRKWSFNSTPIKERDHKKWFSRTINNANNRIWIFECDDEPSGLVRIEMNQNDEKAILNYLIAPDRRRMGLAPKMLKLALNEVKIHWKNIKIFAYTLNENIASQKSLEKAGFSLFKSSKEKVCYAYNI